MHKARSSLHRWHEHFQNVLNICSNSEVSVIQSAEQCPVREELAQTLVKDEGMEALGKQGEQGWRENWHTAGDAEVLWSCDDRVCFRSVWYCVEGESWVVCGS